MSDVPGSGAVALRLWNALQDGDLLYLADDEQAAETTAEALRALAPTQNIVFVPSSDTLPGDAAPASPANIGRRLAALRQLRRLAQDPERSHLATIISGEAAARHYPQPAVLDAAPPLLRPGDAIDAGGFAAEMEAIGYVCDDQVDEPGEIAVRGQVIDIFPADAGAPARIDVAEGRITHIRRYDPASQLSKEELSELEVGRAAEPDGENGVSILSHLAPGQLFLAPKAEGRRQRFVRLAADSAGRRDGQPDALGDDQWAKEIRAWSPADPDNELQSMPGFAEQRSPLAAMSRIVRPLIAKGRHLLLVGSERDIRFLRPRIQRSLSMEFDVVADLAAALSAPTGAAALVAPIDRGAVDDRIIMIAAADILGSRSIIGRTAPPATVELTRSSGDIRRGDVIVHEDHGVGRVAGLEQALEAEVGETIVLEYAGGARRLLPVREAERIWRYGADADAVTLDRLDGTSWAGRRATIDTAVREGATALMDLAEKRAKLAAPMIDPDPARYERFVAGFPFNETADQARAIQAVRDDLASGRPMDRLVIGDVGFGKTEVALRAAALAALAGQQVVLAAPTTILVRQHLQTFQQRFADSGIAVAALSRLSRASERKAAKAGLADGTIQIVIGTGAVMGKDVRFANLGLVIIDEEQRFGASDKARLRSRPDIHLLAMSATPIPRTLHRAMVGLQQMSVIATPPARRQPIRTSVIAPDDVAIRTALLRERARHGQSFVVAPRIADLTGIAERLRRLIPDIDLIVAHGKMPVADIDGAMMCFANGEGDVLLATNIIEAGLDVPRANTMIIWHADRFGLAQLHQLRGRVGRGNRRGQVMLLVDGQAIAARTMKRLRTLTTYDQLGSGFAISAADLDQRGAGDPLSDTQAGHMKLIGVDLYQHLFEAALRKARGEPVDGPVPDVRLGGNAMLPADWIPDCDIRLSLYVRLARARDEASIDEMEYELSDRFGPLPPSADLLVTQARIALLAQESGIVRVDAGPAGIALTPHDSMRHPPPGCALSSSDRRWLWKEQTDESERPARVLALLEALIETGNARD